MRIVEFVVAVVALNALFGWLVGRPHTLEAPECQDTPADSRHLAPHHGNDRDAGAGGDAEGDDD